MNEPNAQIIARLQELNCNAIFLFQKIIVRSSNAGIIHTSNLPEGWYIIQVHDKDGNSLYRDKIYIQH
ncbi:MAG: hypothetical protein ACP5O2_01175 [Bacteroidales bacterium]